MRKQGILENPKSKKQNPENVFPPVGVDETVSLSPNAGCNIIGKIIFQKIVNSICLHDNIKQLFLKYTVPKHNKTFILYLLNFLLNVSSIVSPGF